MIRKLLFLFLLSPTIALAQETQSLNGQAIMQEQVRRYRDGIRTEIERFTMEHGLANDRGDGFESDADVDRADMIRVSQYSEASDISMTQIDGPSGSSGIGLKMLSREERTGERHIWRLYVRLPDDEVGHSFVGSENKRVNSSGLSYRDLKFLENKQVLEDYDYEKLREEAVNGAQCFVLRARPRANVNCEYSQVDLWIRMDNFFTVKIVTYDKSRTQRSWKTFMISGLVGATVGGRQVVRANKIDVNDEREQYRTVLRFTARRINVDIEPALLTEAEVDAKGVSAVAIMEERR